MKNLKTYLYLSKHIDIDTIKCLAKGRDILGKDTFENSLNILISTKDCVYSYSCLSQKLTCLCNISEFTAQPAEEICIVSLIYNDISDSLIVCLENGSIISLQFHEDEVGEFNCLACVPGNIECVEWSPDCENVLMSNSKSLFIISATYYEILHDIDLSTVTGGENELVNVGWGKKETQFHGSEGKGAAKKIKVTIDRSLINDDHKSHISWRGDGLIFSVSYWDSSANLRFIKTFDKSGILLAINEEIPGLTGPISWRPYGDLLAFSEWESDHYVIGFLEKNGLKHGDFKIPPDLKVKQVSWNSDSSSLGLVCVNEATQNDCLLLWTVGNYHWYLKQKVDLTSPLMCLLWDDAKSNRLYGACQDGTLFTLELITTIDSNKEWCAGDDNGYVAVIDNDEVLLTSFKEAIIPPPMCRWHLKCPEAVSCILFPAWSNQEFSHKSASVLCTITHNLKFILWERCNSSIEISETLVLSTSDTSSVCIPNSMNHWLWMAPDTFVTTCNISASQSLATLFQIKNGRLDERSSTELPFYPISLHCYNGDCFVQSTSGELSKINFASCSITKFLSFPEPCYRIEINSSGAYCLSEKNRLYKDGEQIGSQVTSFLLHGSFLLATTSLHNLIIFKNITDKCKEICSRKLENGSKLIVATDTTVIFQLPRGNLEAIKPRALTVETAGKLLDSKMFKEAVSLLSCQRIDLNLAVDHNPDHFLRNVGEFVRQVDPKWLTLLITELKPDSVTSGIYAEFYEKNHPSLPQETKVKLVCHSLYDEMIKNQNIFILPILGSLVKMGSMSEALKLASSEDSLQHLLFLVDVDRLYDEALLSYNLAAALKIAGKSQKDPKEYLPYLNKLRMMEVNYMKYSIDKSLNRPESALKHIAQCQGDEKFIECINLIKEHSLYSTALKLFKNDLHKYKVIAELYGDYLLSLKRFTEAGLVYKRSGTPRKAVDPFLKIGDWRECIALSNQCGYSDKEKESLIQTLKGVLKGTQKFHDAADLCLEVMNDVNMCIEMLALGKHWKEAVYIAKSKGQETLIESIIKKTLLEHSEMLRDDIETNAEQITKYCSRLRKVREDKLKTEVAPIAEPWDIQSDTSSVSSFRTSNTSVSRSSKNTRKASRKMWSLKEGNPREEQALMSTLTETVETTEKLSVEIQTTCLSLLELCCDDVAYELQGKFKNLVELCNRSKNFIWPKDPDVDEIALMDERLKIPPASSIMTNWELDILK